MNGNTDVVTREALRFRLRKKGLHVALARARCWTGARRGRGVAGLRFNSTKAGWLAGWRWVYACVSVPPLAGWRGRSCLGVEQRTGGELASSVELLRVSGSSDEVRAAISSSSFAVALETPFSQQHLLPPPILPYHKSHASTQSTTTYYHSASPSRAYSCSLTPRHSIVDHKYTTSSPQAYPPHPAGNPKSIMAYLKTSLTPSQRRRVAGSKRSSSSSLLKSLSPLNVIFAFLAIFAFATTFAPGSNFGGVAAQDQKRSEYGSVIGIDLGTT